MKIRSERLKALAAEKNLGAEQLAAAVARKGLDEQRAASAVRNWMRGSDHPRCQAQDVRAMAGALGCTVVDIARFTTVFKHHRGSPRKAKLLTDMIRGKNILDAENMLKFTTKRAAVDVLKALKAAISDAQLAEADETRLVVADARVDDGPVMKRFQPKDRGRAHPILKRMTHITVGVEEQD